MPDEMTTTHLRDAATLAVALHDPSTVDARVLADIMATIARAGGTGVIAQATTARMLAELTIRLVDVQILGDTDLLLRAVQRGIGRRPITCAELGLTVGEVLRSLLAVYAKDGAT